MDNDTPRKFSPQAKGRPTKADNDNNEVSKTAGSNTMQQTKDLVSKDYIFTQSSDGTLTFEGRFEDYYSAESDPWEQSGSGEMQAYYQASRDEICHWLLPDSSIMEVGCGLGYALEYFSQRCQAHYTGIDISQTAINKAKSRIPDANFTVANICLPAALENFPQQDVIILNQLLWYILDDLDTVFHNIEHALKPGGRVILSNAFVRTQKYGTDKIDGFTGAVSYFSKNLPSFKLTHAAYNDKGFRHIDGIFVLHKQQTPTDTE